MPPTARAFYKILRHCLWRRPFVFPFQQQAKEHPSTSIQNFNFATQSNLTPKTQSWLIPTEVVAEVVTTPISAVTGTNRIVVDGYIRTGMLVLNARYLANPFFFFFFLTPFTYI